MGHATWVERGKLKLWNEGGEVEGEGEKRRLMGLEERVEEQKGLERVEM